MNKSKLFKEIADKYDVNNEEQPTMNKQEIIDKLNSAITQQPKNDYQRVENIALNYATDLVNELKDTTPPYYQGTTQPIDLINAQDLNFNLGNVVKYVCRAGKKDGENILSDLEKAKNYINFEIERLKK